MRDEVRKGALSLGHARAMLTLPDPARIVPEVMKKGLSVRQTERLVQRMLTEKAPRESPGAARYQAGGAGTGGADRLSREGVCVAARRWVVDDLVQRSVPVGRFDRAVDGDGRGDGEGREVRDLRESPGPGFVWRNFFDRGCTRMIITGHVSQGEITDVVDAEGVITGQYSIQSKSALRNAFRFFDRDSTPTLLT